MSTRAFVTIIDPKKNIQAAAFNPSSAYPSYFGLEVLDAIRNYNVEGLISQLKEDYPEEVETADGIQRSWYVKDKTNKDNFFQDYAYEVNGATMDLTLYQRGEKALTIPADKLDLYRFIFEHENELYLPLTLDEKSMTCKKDFYKEVRDMIKNGADISAFQKVMDDNPSVLHIETGRVKDATNYYNDGFNKYISDGYHNGQLMICVSKPSWSSFFNLYVQTPFSRICLTTRDIRSAASAEKAIADLVRDKPDSIRATIQLFEELSSFSKQVTALYKQDDIPLDDRADKAHALTSDMLARVKEVQKDHNILGFTPTSLESAVRHVTYDNLRWAKERQNKELLPTTALDAAIQNAKQRSDSRKSTSNSEHSPEHTL